MQPRAPLPPPVANDGPADTGDGDAEDEPHAEDLDVYTNPWFHKDDEEEGGLSAWIAEMRRSASPPEEAGWTETEVTAVRNLLQSMRHVPQHSADGDSVQMDSAASAGEPTGSAAASPSKSAGLDSTPPPSAPKRAAHAAAATAASATAATATDASSSSASEQHSPDEQPPSPLFSHASEAAATSPLQSLLRARQQSYARLGLKPAARKAGAAPPYGVRPPGAVVDEPPLRPHNPLAGSGRARAPSPDGAGEVSAAQATAGGHGSSSSAPTTRVGSGASRRGSLADGRQHRVAPPTENSWSGGSSSGGGGGGGGGGGTCLPQLSSSHSVTAVRHPPGAAAAHNHPRSASFDAAHAMDAVHSEAPGGGGAVGVVSAARSASDGGYRTRSEMAAAAGAAPHRPAAARSSAPPVQRMMTKPPQPQQPGSAPTLGGKQVAATDDHALAAVTHRIAARERPGVPSKAEAAAARQRERVAKQLEAAIAKGAQRAAQADASSMRSQRMLAAQQTAGMTLAGGAVVHASVFAALEMNQLPAPQPKAAPPAPRAPAAAVPRVARAVALSNRAAGR